MIAHRPYRALILTAVAAAALASSASGAEFADPAAIDRAVEAFTGAPLGAVGGAALPIDRRLRLAPCGAPLDVAWRGDRRDTVLVKCPNAGWHLFVAVRGAMGLGTGVAAVSRGEEVTVAITGDGFTVSQTGEAMENGAIGDWIRVNPTKDSKATNTPIRAQVTRPGLVSVLLP